MECNKEEGIRAKELAEKKLTEDDFWGAKRLALKAQSLFPGLEGLSQFQEMLDVHISRQKMVNGEVDWYEILGVDPLADNETIKKRYRTLALQLHPDKNKSVGADGAFKIIYEAWSLLSDKESRDAYNLRRNVRAAYQMADYVNPPAGPGKSTPKSFTHSSSKARSPSARKNSLRNWKASCTKDEGKTSADNAGKSSFTNNSSSTIDPATPDDFRQDTGTSYQKDAHQDTPASDGKSGHKAFSNVASSTRNNVATAEDSSHSVPSAPRGVTRTFCIECDTCNLLFEYLQVCKKMKVLCDTCQKSSKAIEILLPMGIGAWARRIFEEDEEGNGASPTRNVVTSEKVDRSKTFWGGCSSCEVLYQYIRDYKNRKKLRCNICWKSLIAREMPPHHSRGKGSSTKLPCTQKQQVRDGGSSSEARSVSSAGKPAAQDKTEHLLGKKRTVPEAEMAANEKRRRT